MISELGKRQINGKSWSFDGERKIRLQIRLNEMVKVALWKENTFDILLWES